MATSNETAVMWLSFLHRVVMWVCFSVTAKMSLEKTYKNHPSHVGNNEDNLLSGALWAAKWKTIPGSIQLETINLMTMVMENCKMEILFELSIINQFHSSRLLLFSSTPYFVFKEATQQWTTKRAQYLPEKKNTWVPTHSILTTGEL